MKKPAVNTLDRKTRKAQREDGLNRLHWGASNRRKLRCGRFSFSHSNEGEAPGLWLESYASIRIVAGAKPHLPTSVVSNPELLTAVYLSRGLRNFFSSSSILPYLS
jgi:hypothetical protein